MALDQPSVTTSDSTSGIIATWDGISGADSYELRWSFDSADCYSGTLVEGATSPYTLSTEYYGKDHFISVTAISSGDASPPSSAADGIPWLFEWEFTNITSIDTLNCVKKFNNKLYAGTNAGQLVSKPWSGSGDWEQQGIDCPLDDIKDLVYDESRTRIWVGGTSTNVGGTYRSVYYTDDFGSSWTAMPTIGNGPGTQNDILKDTLIFKNDILFYAGREGKLAGTWSYRACIWSTSDFATWDKVLESSRDDWRVADFGRNFAGNSTINTADTPDSGFMLYCFFSFYRSSPAYGIIFVSSDGGLTFNYDLYKNIYSGANNGKFFKHINHRFYYFDINSKGIYEGSGDTLYYTPTHHALDFVPAGADLGEDRIYFWGTSNDTIYWWCWSDTQEYDIADSLPFSLDTVDFNAIYTGSYNSYLVGAGGATSYIADWIGVLHEFTYDKLRMLFIGDSDYSDQVITWPKITRKANNFQSTSVTIPLDNNSGHLNLFYNNVFNIPKTCTLRISDPSTDYDLQIIYTGQLNQVKYRDNKCIITLKDKLFDFYNIKVGDNDNPIEYNNVIPTDILWDICTSYGLLDNTAGTGNSDIDYTSFLNLAYTYSYDQITCNARFSGAKISTILTDFVKMTNSLIYTERNGKLKFKNFLKEQSSDFVHLDTTKYNDFEIDIDTKRIINKQYIYMSYDADSNDWEGSVYRENASSQDSYGLYENIIKSDKIWYTNTADANVIADQILLSYYQPPKEIKIKSTLYAREYEIGDGLSFTNSFYGLGDDDDWRITEYIFDMSNGSIEFTLDGAMLNPAFYLDISYLDGDDLLL